MFGGEPAPSQPARRARAPRPKAPPAPAADQPQDSKPAAELQARQVAPAAPPAPTPQVEKINIAPRGRLVSLHDGRLVDSWSAEWRDECLASTLLQLSNTDRKDWIAGYAELHGKAAEQELLRKVMAVAAARLGDQIRRR